MKTENETINREHLESLIVMWMECRDVCFMVKLPGYEIEAAAYQECASHLREILNGNLGCIEKL